MYFVRCFCSGAGIEFIDDAVDAAAGAAVAAPGAGEAADADAFGDAEQSNTYMSDMSMSAESDKDIERPSSSDQDQLGASASQDDDDGPDGGDDGDDHRGGDALLGGGDSGDDRRGAAPGGPGSPQRLPIGGEQGVDDSDIGAGAPDVAHAGPGPAAAAAADLPQRLRDADDNVDANILLPKNWGCISIDAATARNRAGWPMGSLASIVPVPSQEHAHGMQAAGRD